MGCCHPSDNTDAHNSSQSPNAANVVSSPEETLPGDETAAPHEEEEERGEETGDAEEEETADAEEEEETAEEMQRDAAEEEVEGTEEEEGEAPLPLGETDEVRRAVGESSAGEAAEERRETVAAAEEMFLQQVDGVCSFFCFFCSLCVTFLASSLLRLKEAVPDDACTSLLFFLSSSCISAEVERERGGRPQRRTTKRNSSTKEKST